MQIYLKLALAAALSTPIVSFAPALSGNRKALRYAAAAVGSNEIKTTQLDKETHDTWVANEFDQGPPEWLQEDKQSATKSQVKEYDWFSTAQETYSSTPFLLNKQVSGPLSPQNLRGGDWFAEAITSSAPIIPEAALPLDKAPREWFTHAIYSGFPSLKRDSATAEWFAEAIKFGTPEQPAAAPSFDEGGSGWLARAIPSDVPSKPSEAPDPKQGSANWFAQAIKADVVEPSKTLISLKPGPNEWFSQEITSKAPVSPQVVPFSVHVPPGPSELFSDAMTSMDPSVAVVKSKQEKMTPHEWFTVGRVEYTPGNPATDTSTLKDTPRELFMNIFMSRLRRRK